MKQGNNRVVSAKETMFGHSLEINCWSEDKWIFFLQMPLHVEKEVLI